MDVLTIQMTSDKEIPFTQMQFHGELHSGQTGRLGLVCWGAVIAIFFFSIPPPPKVERSRSQMSEMS